MQVACRKLPSGLSVRSRRYFEQKLLQDGGCGKSIEDQIVEQYTYNNNEIDISQSNVNEDNAMYFIENLQAYDTNRTVHFHTECCKMQADEPSLTICASCKTVYQDEIEKDSQIKFNNEDVSGAKEVHLPPHPSAQLTASLLNKIDFPFLVSAARYYPERYDGWDTDELLDRLCYGCGARNTWQCTYGMYRERSTFPKVPSIDQNREKTANSLRRLTH